MFRPSQPGDWAADDEEEVKSPVHSRTSSQAPAAPAAAAARRENSNNSRNNKPFVNNFNPTPAEAAQLRQPRQEKPQPPPRRQEQPRQEQPRQEQAAAAPAAPVANRWEKFRQQQHEPEQQQQQSRGGDHDYNRSGSGSGRDRDYEGGGGGGGGRDYHRGGDYGGGRDRDRDHGYGGGGGGRDRDYNSYGGGGRDRDHRDAAPPMATERGVVVAIKDSFGFVSCVEREGDLFFHLSEAPVDVELQDEVEFKVKNNQRAQKDIAVQLVRLPKGSIVWEEVADEFVEGVVSKGIPRSSAPNSHYQHSTSSRDELHGLIEVRRVEDAAPADVVEAKEAAEGAETEAPAAPAAAAPPSAMSKRRQIVRYTAESVVTSSASSSAPPPATEGEAAAAATSEKETTAKPSSGGRKPPLPHVGDQVRFRIATHRKSGQKRAVDLTITVSAKAKLEKEMAAKLVTMTREQGMVASVKSSGGFIRCCDRKDDVFFPFHEIRESVEDDALTKSKGKLTLRDGDEVSFFVYEDKDGDSSSTTSSRSNSSSHRLTALRVVKLPAGTVSFEDVLQTDLEGVVTKTPKEPRNGPEVLGVINPTNPDVVVVAEAAVETDQENKSTGGKKLKKKPAGIAFRLSDAQDVSYVPATGDVVLFDQVMDKRTRRVKASNVRVVQLNPKHRETGVITTVRDEFGFIKCADRNVDAYFRFADVMSVANDFRPGTEVAFDVSGGDTNNSQAKGKDSRQENVRATRVQLLPSGSVQWETVLAAELEGEIVAVPSRGQHKQGAHHQKPSQQQLHKSLHGRVRVSLSNQQHLVDFFPAYKDQIDAVFGGDKAADSSGSSTDKEKENELKVEFPTALSKYERAAIHAYCDHLGLKHESTGDGADRRLVVTADPRAAKKKEPEAATAATATTVPQDAEIEFQAEDVVDVRYNPHLGDRVKLNLVLTKRSKLLLGKKVTLVTAAPPKAKSAAAAAAAAGKDKDGKAAELPTGEGFIVGLKSDGGFGFIQPADQALTGVENLFFHVKEILSGETQVADLKEGMEVQYRVSYDDKKKKSRAVAITVVPAGTVKKVEVSFTRGVVHRPSLLHRFRKTSGRYGGGKNDKNKQLQMSSPGRIRLVVAGAAAAAAGEAGAKEDEDAEDDEDEEGEEEEDDEGGDEAVEEAGAKQQQQPKKAKKKGPSASAASSSYTYYINDIMDPTVVLRDGDEIEFVATNSTSKGLRATKIRLVQSHAKQGVVVSVSATGGVIRVDAATCDGLGDVGEEVGFLARNVLRGDLLGEGDRVEFALVKRPQEKNVKAKVGKQEAAAPTKEEEGGDEEKTGAAAETTEEADQTGGEEDAAATTTGPELTSAYIATGVLCLVSAGNSAKGAARDVARPESRTVNSTLRQAMRQTGASAVVKSRMAKGPDGTRGFKQGWRVVEAAAAAGEAVAVAVPAATEPAQ